MDWVGVAANVASVALVPHSNQAVAARPFGFTVPFSVALSAATEVAALVITVGDGAVVLKERIDPFDVPAVLEAAPRK